MDLRHFQRQRPPVVLLGGLNLLRALAMARIPALVASPEPDAPVLASRFVAGRLALPPRDNPAATAAALAAAGARIVAELGVRVPLVYGDDDWLALLQSHRALLAPHFSFVLNDPAVADALIAKDAFAELGRRRGLPLPRALAWDELERFDGEVLVKPRVKIDWWHSPLHRRLFGGVDKARVFASGRALAANDDARRVRGELVVQEYIVGDDRELWSFHGFADERGRLLASFVGRKIRTFPARTGMSCYLEMAHDGEIAALGRDVAARLPLKGPFKMDFKRDPKTRRAVLLEVNARFNLWHHVAAKNGVNLPQVAYEWLLERRRPAGATRYRTTYRWLCLRLDWKAFRADPKLGLARWLASLVAAPKVYDLFAWNDPAPFVQEWLKKWKRIVQKLPLRVRQWLSTAS